MGTLLLKFGTLKGWDDLSQAQIEALEKWRDSENGLGTLQASRTDESNRLLCEALDLFEDGQITNDWDGCTYTIQQAKNYIMEYGK